ncbi:ATP-binding protein [Olivibacter sp. 47]|uniref:tetratricopeptide repeat-containing sensor histidine kinase n=1 Tax=Olivibacter sp. 47 TaxID=3056486 RepID=UPI0025A469F5|nr:ATP-binding protein [Olivibacter sp. 47]MDM8175851.1 ATP-binding protein [Olivibacter sp. 47]
MRSTVRYTLFSLLIMTIVLPLRGKQQSPLIDSLKRELKNAHSDTLKARLYVGIGSHLASSDSSGGFQALKKGLSLALSSGEDYYIANAYASLARFFQIYYLQDSAESYYQKAEHLLLQYSNVRNQKLLLFIKQNHLTLKISKEPDKALNEALSLVPLAYKVGDQVTLGNLYNNIGVWFMNISQYEKAIQYFKKSVAVKIVERKQYARFAYSYVNLAACYYRSDRIDEMKPYLDEAKNYLLKANDRQEVWSWYYNYRGLYAFEKKQYQPAEKDLLKGLSIAKKETDALAQSNILGTLVKLKQAMGDNQRALAYAQENVRLNLKGSQLGALDDLADIYEKIGDYKHAYEAKSLYAHLADSLNESEKKANLNEIEEKFQNANKQKQILQLLHENEVKSFALQKNRLYTGLLTATSLLLLTLAVLYFQSNRHHKKQLIQHKKLHQLEMDKISQHNQISLLSAMLNGQESERTRIARDLHDGLGGLLSALKIELSSALKKENKHTKLTDPLKKIDYAVDELRFISQNLMPETLLKYGLGEAIKSYCSRMRNKGIQLVCQIFHYNNELTQEKELILYRIMQELVTNAIRHAKASTIFVQLLKSEDKVTLTVEDNGIGFDKTLLVKNRAGNGLTNILSRIEYIQGELDVHSQIGNGTTFTIECNIKS